MQLGRHDRALRGLLTRQGALSSLLRSDQLFILNRLLAADILKTLLRTIQCPLELNIVTGKRTAARNHLAEAAADQEHRAKGC